MKVRSTKRALGVALGTLIFSTTAILADAIHTSPESEAYHGKLCPRLEDSLKKAQFKHKCTSNPSSTHNMQLVQKNAMDVGYAQFDIYALKNSMQTDRANFRLIRKDIGVSCLFMVSKNRTYTNLGQVIANAPNVKMVLPYEQSAHVATFEYLQQIDAAGLGQLKTVRHVITHQQAVDEVLNSSDPDLITVFVDLPDPDNETLKSVTQRGGHFVPFIDRTILRQDIAGEKIYFAEETEIKNAPWIEGNAKLLTTCTPIALFTGATEKIRPDQSKKDHEDLIRTIAALPLVDLQPKQDFFAKLWSGTQSISTQSLDKLIETSEKARQSARPYIERARDVAGQAVEQSKPVLDKVIEESKPALEKAQDFGSQTLEKAGDITEKALETSKPYVMNAFQAGKEALNDWRDKNRNTEDSPPAPRQPETDRKKAEDGSPPSQSGSNQFFHHLMPAQKP